MASNSQTKPGTRGKTCFLPRRDKPTTSLGGLTFSEHMELWQSERDAFTSVFDLEKREKGTDDEVEPCFGAQPRTGTQGMRLCLFFFFVVVVGLLIAMIALIDFCRMHVLYGIFVLKFCHDLLLVCL